MFNQSVLKVLTTTSIMENYLRNVSGTRYPYFATLVAPSSSNSALSNLLPIVLGSLIMGLILGLIPFIVGRIKDQRGLAIGGLICCIIGSFVLGLILSVPICIIFTVLIFVKSSKK